MCYGTRRFFYQSRSTCSGSLTHSHGNEEGHLRFGQRIIGNDRGAQLCTGDHRNIVGQRANAGRTPALLAKPSPLTRTVESKVYTGNEIRVGVLQGERYRYAAQPHPKATNETANKRRKQRFIGLSLGTQISPAGRDCSIHAGTQKKRATT
jgi:hypothetical protein